MRSRLSILVVFVLTMCFHGKASAQLLATDSLYLGGTSRFMAVICYQLPENTFLGENTSIYKGGDSKAVLMGCTTQALTIDGQPEPGGLYKGGDVSNIIILDCTPPERLTDAQATSFTGGSSREMAISCGEPVLLTLEDDAPIGIYKGGPSNDYFVDCVEKPSIVDINLPLYQGGRSYEEILSCDINQLGKGTLFVGGISREMAVACNQIVIAGGGPFFGDTSAIMLTETACFTIEGSLTGENFYGGGISRGPAEDCQSDVSLGEPTGGYYLGGESMAPAVDCYLPPCLDLQPAVITSLGAVPVCVGKTITLTASPASSRKWQRYNTSTTAWDEYSTASYITVGSEMEGDFRLISFSTSAGCADTSAVFYAQFVTNIPQPVISVEGTNVICQGGSMALRSSQAHEYLWSNGATTQTIWVTQGGEYTVTITDINGCQATSEAATLVDGIATAPAATISPSGKIELCAGTSQTLTASAASAYQWSNGATSQAISVSEAGKYTVRIADGNNCQATADTVEIVVHDVRPVVSHKGGLTICYGAPVELSLAPHTGNIQWYKDGAVLPGKTGTTVQVTETGTYHAVLDTLGCQFASPVVTVNSNNTITPLAAITPSHPVLCAGGNVTLTAAEASKYAWSTGDDTQTIWTDAPGTYTLTVEDAFGCQSATDFILNEVPVTLQPEIQAVTGQLALCPGASVTLRVSEGTSFAWSNGETTQEITVAYADAGNYSAIVYDANGCAVTADAVEVSAVETITPVVDAVNAVICGNEPLPLSVLPVDDNYTYEWSNGATTPYIEITTAGNYSATIITPEGCRFTSAQVVVSQAPAPVKPVITSPDFTITNDTIKVCPNQVDRITLTSTAAQSYYWSTGDETRSITTSGEGKYVVMAEYANTCTAVSDTIVVTLVDNFVSIEVVDDETRLCPGGSIDLNVVGAEAGSTFEWYKDNSNVPVGTQAAFAATSAGFYYARVTGAGGCTETTDTLEITNFPTVPPVISSDGSLDICPYDSVHLIASEGVAYLWNTGDDTEYIYASKAGRYIVTITDEFGCMQKDSVEVTVKPEYTPVIKTSTDIICQGDTLNLSVPAPGGSTFAWSNGETTSAIAFDNPARFGSQAYWVEVTYPEGCTFRSADKSIFVNKAPRQPEITIVGSNSICPDRTVALIATKSDEYKYLWRIERTPGTWVNYPDGNSFGIVVDENANYDVTITDNLTRCSSRSDVLELTSLSSATVEIYPKGPISICEKDGWVKLEAFDAKQRNVAYIWNTGETTKSIIVTQVGYYRVTVTELESGNHCEITSKYVEVRNGSTLPPPTITVSGATTFCEGGKLTLTSSMSPDSRYEWRRWTETDTTVVGNWQQLEVTESGQYMMVFTDSKGCKVVSKRVIVTVNPIPEAVISPAGTFTVCGGERMKLSANEGPGYIYKWSAPSNATTRVLEASIGTHTVTVTTPQGCSRTSEPVIIRQATNQAPMPNVTNAGTCEGETAKLTATSTIANPEFKWWDAATDGNLLGTGSVFEIPALNVDDDIWVTVSSDNMCESQRRKVTVSVGQKVEINITTPGNLSVCNFGNLVPLTATPSGGVFSGNGVGGTSFDPTLTEAGIHYVYYTVTNRGCPSVDSIPINVLQAPQIVFGNVPATICSNEASFIVDVYPDGGVLKGNGLDNGIFNPAVAGPGIHYLVYSVTDAGCSRKDSVKITVYEAPVPMITNTETVVGISSGTFALTATPAGGVFTGTGVVTSAGKAFFDPQIAGEGDHEITYTVSNTNGCSEIAFVTFRVVPKPKVDQPAVPDAVCEGGLLAVTEPAYDLHGATLVNKEWLLGGVPFNPATKAMTTADNGKILQYKVVSGAGETVSQGVAITIKAKPSVAAISAPAAVCEGSTLTPPVTPAITSNGAQITAQGWLLDGITFEPGTTVLTYADHNKKLQYYVTSDCGNDTTLAVTITVNAVRVAPIADPQTVCAGGTLAIVAPVVTGGATVSNAYWTIDGTVADLATRVFDITDEGKKLKYMAVSSCGNAESNEATIHTGAKSTAPVIVMNPLNGIICGTGSVTLSTASFATYQWYKDNVPFAATATIIVNETQAGAYTVEGAIASGCQSELSVPATVSVQATLAPVINGITTVCDETIEHYTINGLPGNAADYTYEWTATGGTVQGSNIHATVNAKWIYGGTPTLELKVKHKVSECEATVVANITVSANPALGTMIAPVAVCEGGTITLPAPPGITSPGTPIISQGWLLDKQPFNPATVFTYADNGRMLRYFVTTACGNDTTAGVPVTVNAAPLILGIADDYTVCAGGLLDPGTPIVTVRGDAITDAYWTLDGVRVDLSARRFADTDEDAILKYVVVSVCGSNTSNEAKIHIGAKSPAPVVTMNPENGYICATGSVTLEASGYDTYLWHRNGIPFATTAVITVDQTQAGNYSVRGFSMEGCESDWSEAAVVSVQTPPAPAITGTTVVCEGTEAVYKITGLTGDAGDYSYAWTVAGGTIDGIATLDSVMVAWDYNVTHLLELTITETLTGCTGTTSFTGLTVNPAPGFTVTNPPAVCPGKPVNLLSAVPVNSSVTYTFYEANQEEVENPSGITAPSNGASYYVQASHNTTGCLSEMKIITVSSKPAPVVTITPAAQVLCHSAETADIVFSSTMPGTTYKWVNNLPGVGLTASGTTDEISSFTAANTGALPVMATVTVTPTAGECAGEPQTTTITVNPNPEITVNAPATICAGVEIDLATLVTATIPANFNFYLDDGLTPVEDPGAVLLAVGDTTFFVQAVNQTTGCKGVMKTITFRGIASPSFDVTDPERTCEGNTVDLRTSVPADNTVTYTFYDTNGTDAIAPVITPVAGINTYYVQAVSKANYCPSIKKSISVSVNATPTVHIEAPNGTSVCNNQVIALNAVTTGQIDYLNWYDSNGRDDNTRQFAPGVEFANVEYNPDASEAGTTVKLYVRVRDRLCATYQADTIRIRVLPQPTAAAFELVTQPRAFQEMCVDTVYEVKVKASDLGDLDTIKIKLHDINATGLAIKSASLKQPYLSGSLTKLTNFVDDQTGTTWTLPNLLQSGDSLLVQVTIAAECDFFSGSNLNFNLNAKDMCGTPLAEMVIPTATFNTRQDTAQLNSYDLSSEFSVDTVTNNTSDMVTWRLQAIVHGKQPTDDEKETMVVLIPKGLTVIPNSYDPIQNAPGRSQLSYIDDQFGVEFNIPVKSGLVEGDTIIAELRFLATGTPCGKYDFYAEIVFSDSVDCRGTMCTFNSTRGGVYPTLEVERYRFTPTDKTYGRTINGLWYGDVSFIAQTQFYAGDSAYIDYYVDRDNSGTVSQVDTLVRSFTYITENVAPRDTFSTHFDSVYVEKEKQLIGVLRGKAFCSTAVFPIATILGTDTICQADTSYYYTAAGMQTYKWNVIVPDGISGATPVRIPLEGSSEANYINENIARVVWKKQGDYTVWAQYSMPTIPPHELSPTHFPVHVNKRPVLLLTGDADTTICQGSQLELSHFFSDTTGIGTLSFYRLETDGSMTFLSDQSPCYVSPVEGTLYSAMATAGPSGCQSGAVEFFVNVSKMPQIAAVSVYAQPECGISNGSIRLAITGGNSGYQYSIDGGATYTDLSADGIIGNLPVGNYRVYVKDKSDAGCAPSIGDPVSLNPVNSTLRAVAQAGNAGNCTSNDGNIKLLVNGGVAPYRYRVNGGGYTNIPANGIIGTNFPAGTYDITVMDAANCVAAAGETEIVAASGPKLSLSQVAPANCNAAGKAVISLTGGTPGYSYRLSGKGWVIMSGLSETVSMGAGLHEIFAKDAAGCQASDTIRIENTTGLTLTLTGTTHAVCNGIGGGDISLYIGGGTAPFSLSIDGGATTIPAVAGADTLQGLNAGTYHILLADASGCTTVLEGVEISESVDFLQAVDNRIYTYADQYVASNLMWDDFESNQSTLTVTSHTAPLHGTITLAANGDFTYTPAPDFTGKDSVQYTITSSCGFTSSAWLHIRILDANATGNRAPIAQDDDYSVKAGQSLLNIDVRENDLDPDGDMLSTPMIISTVSRGTLIQNGGMFSYTPNAGFTGVDVFTYRVCDPDGACAKAQVHITVLPDDIFTGHNVALPDIYTMAKNDVLKVSNVADGILKNDVYPQGSTPVITITDSTAFGTITLNTANGTFTFTPDSDYAGADGFTYILCSNTSAQCDTARVTIFVSGQECPDLTPTIEGLSEACPGDHLTYDTNQGYDTYQWNIVSGTGGTMEGAGTDALEYFTWSEAGQKVISVTVTDDNGCKGSATKTIEVVPQPKTGPIYRISNH